MDSMGSIAAFFNSEDPFADDNDRSGGQVHHTTPRISDESSFNSFLANLSSTPYPEQTDQDRSDPQLTIQREQPQQQVEAEMAGTRRDQAHVQSQAEPVELDRDPEEVRESLESSHGASKSQPISSQQNQQLQTEAERHSSQHDVSSSRHSRNNEASSSRQDASLSSEQFTANESLSRSEEQQRHSNDSDVGNSSRASGCQAQDQERHEGDESRRTIYLSVDSTRHSESQRSLLSIESDSQPRSDELQRHEGDVESQSQPIITVFSDANADVLHFEPDSSESLGHSSMKMEGENTWTSNLLATTTVNINTRCAGVKFHRIICLAVARTIIETIATLMG